MEKAIREKIEKRLKEFIGMELFKIYRWQFMPGFSFRDSNGRGIAFHAYSRCMITQGQELLLSSEHILDPCEGVERREDDDYGLFECEYDMEYVRMAESHFFPLYVLSTELKEDGTVKMQLTNNCNFICVPWSDNKLEAWRIFEPDEKDSHLVYLGTGELEE